MDFSDYKNRDYQKFLYEMQRNIDNDFGARSENNVILHSQWIHNTLLNAQPATILDIGCGIGLYSIHLAQLGHHVTGVDVSPYVIEHAIKQSSSLKNCQFIQCDIFDLEINQKFDLVIFPYSIINTFDAKKIKCLFKKIASFLKEDGKFYFEGLHYNQDIGSSLTVTKNCPNNQLIHTDMEMIICDKVWHKAEKILSVVSYTVTNNRKIHKDILKLYYYTHEDYNKLLSACGFKKIELLLAPPGTTDNAGLQYESILTTLSWKKSRFLRLALSAISALLGVIWPF